MCSSWVFTSWCARDGSGVWTYSSLFGWVNSSDCSWPGHYMGSGIADLFALKRSWGITRSFVEIDTSVCDCIYVQFESADLLQSSLTVKIAQDGVNRKDWLIAWW
ncbi:hypothetical protein V6N12_023998 [Hibiscus sabdariffa]|uniref:Uncharacterized protein n=1 Tax=Hibiscus sabdariffa TaxID=183260 RepID=A0ABR2FZZ4_9ROSI